MPEMFSIELTVARRKLREALRRVNQDYAVWGEADRDLLRRLESARRQVAYLSPLAA